VEKLDPFEKLPEKLIEPFKYPNVSKNPLIVANPRNFVVERYCRLKLLETAMGSGKFPRN